MSNKEYNLTHGEDNTGIDLLQIFYLCWEKWYWLVLSFLLSLSIGVLYILRTPAVYCRQAMVLIKDDQSARNTSIERQFAQIGLTKSSSVNNEILAFQSPALTEALVHRLHLDVNYSVEGTFHNPVRYGSNLPLQIQFLSLKPEEAAQVTIHYTRQGEVSLTGFESVRTSDADSKQVVKGRMHQTLNTPVGRVIVSPTPYFAQISEQPISVYRAPLSRTITRYNRVSVDLAEKNSEMLTLSFSDVSAERATDVLNALIDAYNDAWLGDKKQIALTTSKFINERLRIIEEELGSVDRRISSYKSANLVPNAEAASEIYVRKTEDNNDKLTLLESQLYMAQFVQSAVGNENKEFEILPANSGLNAPAIETMIAEHNRDVLDRNRIVLNSSAANSRVQELDDRIRKQRQAIITSVNNLLVTLQTQIRNLRAQGGHLTSKIAQTPKQSSFLTSIGREQEVKSALYIFLLQKREENELSIAFTALNTRVIAPPTGSHRPIAPIRRNILLIAAALGLLLPLVIIYLREQLNTRIRNRKDLEGLSLPYIGEIPQLGGTERSWWQKLLLRPHVKQNGRRMDDSKIVLEAQSSNFINDAFRVLRSNFEFVADTQEGGTATMVVSANPGSGKTFVAMNLAMSMVFKGKRTIVIDLDLRKAASSSFVGRPKLGISNVLNGQCNFREVICQYEDTKLDVIPVGTIPPNPSELLYSELLGEVITQLRKEYDYIFLDCPPVEIVADSAIISQYADRTLFVARAHLLDRHLLPEIEQFYQSNRYPKMMLMLNGVSKTYKGYGYRRYGYRYGYYGHKG